MTSLLLTPLVNQAQSKADTVIINFGSSSKMVFFINEKGDLEALKSYDLNALVSDMKDRIDAADTTQSQDDGAKYLKDSTLTAQQDTDELVESSSESPTDNYSYDNSQNNNDDDDDDDDDDRWRDQDSDRWRDSDKWRNRDNNIVFSNKLGNDHFINFDLGINNYLEDGESPSSSNAPYAVKPWGSWYFAINSIHRNHIAGRLSVESGFGVSWYNFKFEDPSLRLNKTDTDIQFTNGTADSFKKSKLTASFVNVSLVPVFDFGSKENKGIRIGIGGYAGYRLGSHTKYIYSTDGDREKDKDRGNFYLNNWRYGARLQLGLKGTDFFINYDVNELFDTGRAPKLNALSFGITF
jgi:hypothetical protein